MSSSEDSSISSSQSTQHWQLNKSVIECNRHMLDNGVATDVTFLVSSHTDENTDIEAQTFSAHKYVLVSRSPVFYAMFCGDLAETGVITVTDVHPQAFRQMLEYLYTDELELCLELVIHILYGSKKYQLPGLTTKCVEYIKDHLDTKNVCSILDQILIFEEIALNKFCLNLIMTETHKVLESEAFLSISWNALSKILNIKTCQVKEVDVFKACLKWARQTCLGEEKEATSKNIRGALGHCITQFRFSDIGDFARDVCPTGVLNRKEENGILCHLADRQTIAAPARFNCEARLRPQFFIMAKPMHPTETEILDFKITITSDNMIGINMKSLVIGEASSVSEYSIKYNDAYINMIKTVFGEQNERMALLNCSPPFMIKPGSSTLQITYKSDIFNPKYNVCGVPGPDLILKDDRIALKLSVGHRDRSSFRFSHRFIIPLFGLGYELVFN